MSRIVDTIRREAPAPAEQHEPARAQRRGEPEVGVVQYFHIHDRETVERVLDGLSQLPVRKLRTAISWCDWLSDGGDEWYAWLLPKLTERFEVLPCFLYTPPHLGLMPKTSSPPRDAGAYGEFVEMVLRRHEGEFPYVELWNEPNNYIEWDWTVDPEWIIFAEMVGGAAERAAALGVGSVLGGMSPFDPNWLDLMFKRGALEHVDVIGVHGFPGTWEAVWEGWDTHIDRVQEVLDRHDSPARVWVTEAGFSTWAHDEFRQLTTLVDLAQAPADRVYWYSVQDLAPERETLDGFHCDERAYHFGLQRASGRPKLVARVLADRGLEGVRDLVGFASETAETRPQAAALVTGGAGFIGTNLADRLASSGRPVSVLDSLVRPGAEENLRWLKRKHGALVRVEPGDVRDVFAVRRALAGVDRVFHLAAQVSAAQSLADPRQDHSVNVDGTLNLLEELRRMDEPPRLVFASTSRVYGVLEQLELRELELRHVPADEELALRGISEQHPLDLRTPNACSKGAAEQYVLDYAHSFDLAACALRFGHIYGPHPRLDEEEGWLAHALERTLRGEEVEIVGDGKRVHDLLHVDDLVDAMLAASHERALVGGAFNVGGGPASAASALELVELIEEATGRSLELRQLRGDVPEQRFYVADCARFAALTGWSPKTSLEDGVAALYRWLADARVRPVALTEPTPR